MTPSESNLVLNKSLRYKDDSQLHSQQYYSNLHATTPPQNIVSRLTNVDNYKIIAKFYNFILT